MKRVLSWLCGVILVAVISFVVWNDWLRPSAPPPLTRTAPPVAVEEEIVGIGAVLKRDDETGLAQIISTLPNSPAARAGLSAGSLLLKIDDSATQGLPLQECVQLVRGRAGTKLRLQLWNPDTNATNTVELTRERVAVPALPAEF